MKNILSTAAVAALSLALPAVAQAQSTYSNSGYAHEACKNKEDNRQILGGLAGAVIGGVFGSQVSGNGARTEGSALGAVLGGAAGYGIADKTIDCDPVYPEQRQTAYPAYGSTQTYPTNTVYQDQVTYSNHPVYTQPSYGAGAVNYGTTYTTGTTSYQPYTQGQSYTASSPSYQTTGYPTSSYSGTSVYQTVPRASTYQASYPTSYPSTYAQPVSYTRPVSYATPSYATPRPTGFHYHGSYGCNAVH